MDDIEALAAWQLLPETNRGVMEILIDDLLAPPEYIATLKVISVIMNEVQS